MSTNRLQADHIHVGKALPFDTFDEAGHLLLRKGFVIDNADQLARLLERGLFREPGGGPAANRSLPPGDALKPTDVGHLIPVFALLADIQRRLDTLLTEPAPQDFSTRMQELASSLQRAFKLDGDATIGSIQILHSGRPGVRRMVHGAILCELLLSHTGVSEAERRVVLCAALTMNMAMLDLQDILHAQSSPPSAEQRALLQRHPVQGVAMLGALGVTDTSWLEIVGQHHETIDGKGYPTGQSGSQIARSAQLLSMVDRYGALATGRGYRDGALPNVALKQIFMEKEKSVDASLAGLLVKAVGIYPPGSLVALANGDIAVVVKRTQSASQPVVRCVKTYRNQILEHPRKRLTSEPAYAIARLIPAAQLGFALNPNLLWDEGFELDAK